MVYKNLVSCFVRSWNLTLSETHEILESLTDEEKALSINALQKLDYIVITHEHFDHFHLPFIKDLLYKFPDIRIRN